MSEMIPETPAEPSPDLSPPAADLPAEPAAEPAADAADEPALLIVRPPQADTVLVKVGPPHAGMTWAGYTLTNDPAEVPATAVAGLSEAALNAGVNLILEA